VAVLMQEHLRDGDNPKEYVSNWTERIIRLVKEGKYPQKSIDTLQLEQDEREILNRFENVSLSWITDSEVVFDTKSQPRGEFDTVVVRNNIRDKLNLKNLKKQFACGEEVGVTKRGELEGKDTKEVKTTAATSRRRFEEEKVETVSIRIANEIKNNDVKQLIQKQTSSKIEKRNLPKIDDKALSLFDQENYPAISFNEDKKEALNSQIKFEKTASYKSNRKFERSRSPNLAIDLIRNETLAWTIDLFNGIKSYFLTSDSDEEGGSISSCFGCSKKAQKRSKKITPQSHKIRVTSQLRISKKYFKVDNHQRWKSREFLDNRIVENVVRGEIEPRTSQINEENITGKNSFSSAKKKVFEGSQDRVTNNSSKPQSKLRSDKMDSEVKDKLNLQQKGFSAGMNNLNWVVEEAEFQAYERQGNLKINTFELDRLDAERVSN
jgi:hypothetical protein